MEDIAARINCQLKSSELYKRFVSLKSQVENDETLESLREKMETIKKDVCKSKNNGLEVKYYELEKEYNNKRLIKEYYACKEELNTLLKDIADILSLN
jgi:cell fate (sporulation/competence/biofilm development) regulator YlbF (YheA/YmcA/DUF963 family)